MMNCYTERSIKGRDWKQFMEYEDNIDFDSEFNFHARTKTTDDRNIKKG